MHLRIASNRATICAARMILSLTAGPLADIELIGFPGIKLMLRAVNARS